MSGAGLANRPGGSGHVFTGEGGLSDSPRGDPVKTLCVHGIVLSRNCRALDGGGAPDVSVVDGPARAVSEVFRVKRA